MAINLMPEADIVIMRDEALKEGIANSTFQRMLEKGHEIYRQGWRPIYIYSEQPDGEISISVAREEPDMVRAN